MKFSRTLACTSLVISSLLSARATYYSPRSQGHNAARESVGTLHRMLYKEGDKVHGTFAWGFEYDRSFRPNDITMTIFDQAQKVPCGCGIAISGSAVADRGANDWLADYFGLPTDYQSTVGFSPRIDNLIAPFTLHFGLDEWIKGFYFTIQTPLVHTRWNLQASEHIIDHGTNSYPAGYFSESVVPRNELVLNFLDYAGREDVPNLTGNTDTTFITFDPLTYAKISSCRQTKTRFADITAILGWNFVERDRYHVGFNVRTVMPTGNKPKARYVFEPIVGNGHHWELGAGLTGRCDFWQNKTGDRVLTAYADASATHLFDASQRRTFDMIGKPFSRYMLMQQIQNNQSTEPRLSDDFPPYEFNGVFTPMANISSLDVNVNIGIQTDIVAMLSYSSEHCSFDLGYNFWAHTCENIKRSCSTGCALQQALANNGNGAAFKGNAHVIGFENTPTYTAVLLGATQSRATIHNGTNPAGDLLNTGIDNATPAVSNDALTILNAPAGNQTNSSDPLIFPLSTNLDICGARTGGLTHKIFTHLEYTWTNRDQWTPHAGLGGEAEFGGNKQCCAKQCSECCGCTPCSLSQWGVWATAGISFE